MKRNRKILIVDDNQELLDLIKNFLVANNFEVTTAVSGGKALKYISEKNYDLVISDIQMPGISGLELLERIKKTINADIPVILITGNVSTENVSKAIKLGASDFVGKPFDNFYLLKQIEYQIKKSDKSKHYEDSFDAITKKSIYFRFKLEDFFSKNISMDIVLHIKNLVYMKPTLTNMVMMILEELIENAFIHGVLKLSPEIRKMDHLRYLEYIQNIDRIIYEKRMVDIEIYYNQEIKELKIVVDDHGEGFDYAPIMKEKKSLIDFSETGRGIQIIKMLSDDIQFYNNGSRIIITKKL